jgi:cytochrome c peroxidase
MPVPEDNPVTRQRVVLGRKLFFDRRLSRDNSLSCATCHDPKRGFSDGRAKARGIGNAEGARSSPALINRGYGSSFFWDGRAATLEQQVLEPIVNPNELGLSLLAIPLRAGLEPSEVAAALATYVRTIRSGASRFDRFTSGEATALTPVELDGLNLFRGKANCVSCHVGPNFSDEQFHNTGVAWRDGAFMDEGRFKVGGRAGDRGAFKTPTLREVARTAPYMHDGSLNTLQAVVGFYADGGRPNPYLDREIRPVRLTDREKAALVAFLVSLSGEVREGWR